MAQLAAMLDDIVALSAQLIRGFSQFLQIISASNSVHDFIAR